MNNLTLLVHQPTNFQFLSVCHYITSFGLFFFNQNLIPLEHRNHSVSVLNTFFDYIHNSENESTTKLELLRRVLAGSDLYGGGEDEILDMKYLNETYQYIISNALFSHYGNIHGYLAGIISRAENITYTELKKNVLQQFRESYISRDYCSSRFESIQLTSITIEYVFNQNIWSMFPQPEESIEIMDINYIYAMIGLKIGSSFQIDKNLTFDSYILLSQLMESQIIGNESYQLALELFATPALFYFAYSEKEKFPEDITIVINTDTFWSVVYRKFFHFLNLSVEHIIRESFQKSLFFKFKQQVKEINNRTFIAATIIKKLCNYSNISQVSSSSISMYKTARWMYNLKFARECESSKRFRLPDLEEIYNSQFNKVRETFNQVEQNLMEQILLEGKLIEKMNSNSTVQFASVPHHDMHCMYCAPWPRKINSDIYLLFAITENEETDFYAIRQENNTLILLSSSVNEPEFARAVANDSSLRMEVRQFSRYLKYRDEDYKVFIKRVADIRTELFVQDLKRRYRDPTSAEKVIDFVKSLVPFYTCIENVKSGNTGSAVFSCTLDVLSILPIAGIAVKYSSIMWSSLITKLGPQALWSLSKSAINKLTISTGFELIYKSVFVTLTEEILTKRLLKDIAIASLRTLDPGFELSFRFVRFSIQGLQKTFRFLSSKLGAISKFKNLLFPIESAMRRLNMDAELLADKTGLIPKVIYQHKEYNIVRYLYPGGSNYFGPMCLKAFGKTAELRTIEGNRFKIPVVPSKSGDSIYYGEFDLKSGQVSMEKLKMGGDDILRRMGKYVNTAIAEGMDIRVLRNYHVYHNTIHWNKTPQKVELNQNSIVDPELNHLAPESDTPRVSSEDLRNGDTPHTFEGERNSDIISSSSSRIRSSSSSSSIGSSRISSNGYIHQKDLDTTINLFEKFKLKGLPGLKQDQELLSFRKIVDSMDYYQSKRTLFTPPADLWLTQELTRPSIRNFLENLKGKNFYFNDITLLTDIKPTDIVPKKVPKFSLKTEVRYHIQFVSQFGLLDLAPFQIYSKNHYIVFPEVEFTVTNTQYFNGKNYLVLNLKAKPLTKGKWLRLKSKESTLLDSREITLSKKGECIENEALFISSNTPLHRFTEWEVTLKNYVLKVDDNVVNTVPSYKSLAKDIYASGTIPEIYNEWKIDNNIFINDVLYQTSLHQVLNLESAKSTIVKIFDGIYGQFVEPVFEIYQKSPTIRSLVRFEDYYVIHSFLSGYLLLDVHAPLRVSAALRRLALRQCETELLHSSITIYSAVNLPLEDFEVILKMKTGDYINFLQLQNFHSNREIALKNCKNGKTSEILVMYELRVKNKVGIADITSVVPDPNIEYFVPEEMKFMIINRNKEMIQEKDVFVMTLEDYKLPVEKRIVNLVNELNEILSSDTKFYVNS